MTSDRDGAPVSQPRPPLGAALVVPLLAAALTAYFLIDSSRLVWEARANGTVIGVILLGLVALQLFRIGREVLATRATPGFGDLVERSPLQAQRLGLIAIMVVFILLAPWVGTTGGLFLSLFLSMVVLGVRSPAILLGVSTAVGATVYILFIYLLDSRLPTGPVEAAIGALLGR